jgi:hypothetical protein
MFNLSPTWMLNKFVAGLLNILVGLEQHNKRDQIHRYDSYEFGHT